jgi:hypothetical protein
MAVIRKSVGDPGRLPLLGAFVFAAVVFVSFVAVSAQFLMR